ncbi:MAG: hypothetical protein J2P36_03480, partial [Ktedonobacteraceae bacterium]|nr:hypothetical protein [Ktedonobacteraceae bacterium]
MTQHTATRPALQELQPGTYWVCFDKEKIPYDPVTGKKALANDPTTWGTYEQAQAALRNHPGRYAGIGRELLQDQGIVFIDLGHCI